MIKYFVWGHVIMILSIIGAFFYGSLGAVQTIILLIALEVSMSFDNAVINVKILKHMSPKWQDAFIRYGIPIAVFGMRFAFPIAIVSFAGNISMGEAFTLASTDPGQYKILLDENKNEVFALGGAFLFMIFINWFFEEKDHYWIKFIEDNRFMKACSELHTLPLAISIAGGLSIATLTEDFRVTIYYFTGVLMYETVQIIDDILSPEDENGNMVTRSGAAGFLYLELLDASFSFDGVIGAFALTNDIFLIALGLGVGALYVRELTIYFLHKGTVDEYKYLDHGAHYAIGILAVMMFTKMFIHVDELIVGSIGITLIGIAFIHSLRERRIESKLNQQQ